MAGSVQPDVDAQQRLNPGRSAAAAMVVVGGLLAIVAVVWAVSRFWDISRVPEPRVSEFLGVAALLLAAWAFAALLWGAAELLRRVEDLLESIPVGGVVEGVVESAPRPREVAAAEPQSALLEELVRLTREVRDIELLSDEERAMRLRTEADELARQLEVDVPNLLREHRWVEAQRRVREARVRFPAMPNWDALEQQVEEARSTVEARDIDAVTREVKDLAALGAWDRAAQALSDLQRRHPSSPRVTELAKRIATGRAQAAAEERARLMARAQEATNNHDWTAALERVQLVLERYPDSPEAVELRQQLPTLRANVEIQARQRMEAEIRDLIKEHRFNEALRIAEMLIEQYPDSPQAGVLRDQLPRLREKAGGRSA